MATPPKRQRSAVGFTLIEMMVTIAIIGILTALAVGTFSKLGAQEAPRDAALDFQAYLTKARSIAMDRGADVWVIVYSQFKHNLGSTDAVTGGPGAYFLVLDTDINFGLGSCTANCWSSIDPTDLTTFGTGKLLEKVYLDDYPKQNARFSLASTDLPSAGLTVPTPFNTAVKSGCQFNDGSTALCTGSGNRTAVVFDGEGAARFVQDDGTVISYASASPGGRSAFFGISGHATNQNYLFAINGPTGFIGYYPL